MNRHNSRKFEEPTIVITQESSNNAIETMLGNIGAGEDSVESRTIWFTNEFYPETVATAIQQIQQINNSDESRERKATSEGQSYVRHPIKIYVSSYGGSVYDGLGLIGLIRSSKTPIHTYAIGKVMSMGFVLAVSGHKRFAYPYTSYTVHSLSGFHWGKFSELKESVKEDERLQTMLDTIITSNTSITQDRLNEVHEKNLDWYFDSVDAAVLGCVDEVII